MTIEKRIPICPQCKIPTIRKEISNTGAIEIQNGQLYDEKGRSMEKRREMILLEMECQACKKVFKDDGRMPAQIKGMTV